MPQTVFYLEIRLSLEDMGLVGSVLPEGTTPPEGRFRMTRISPSQCGPHFKTRPLFSVRSDGDQARFSGARRHSGVPIFR